MQFKTPKLYSIAKGKCPRCCEGDFYLTQNAYNLKKFDKMYQRCSECGQDFEMETGFYYGAMYVSYAISVAAGMAVYIAQYMLFDLGIRDTVLIIGSVLLLGTPVVYRLSRLIWINIFVKYDPEASKSKIEAKSSQGRIEPSISKY
jgi:uncharacterized protein (DUF983 family)